MSKTSFKSNLLENQKDNSLIISKVKQKVENTVHVKNMEKEKSFK